MSDIEIVHVPENSRYEIRLDGKTVGFTEAKERDDGVVLFSHTVVDDGHEGEGLAAKLVAGALDDVRAQGRRIEVTCEYVLGFLTKNEEYLDLLV
jgi:predicted GNAT family acetyltransferase